MSQSQLADHSALRAPPRRARWLSGLLAAGMALGLTVLAGCASMEGGGSGARLPASVDRAQRYVTEGNHAAAAAMYEELAGDNPPPARADFALAAAREWLAASRVAEAERALGLIPAGTSLTPPQTLERQLVAVNLQLVRGQAAEAWRQLSSIPVPRDNAGAQSYLQLQQRVAFANGRLNDGVAAGIALERAVTSDAQRTLLRRELLRDLRAAIDRGARVDSANAGDPLLRGWLELGAIAANAGLSPLTAQSDIDRWRGRFPGHPGITVASAEILGAPGTGNAQTVTPVAGSPSAPVALLLPLSGGQGAAAAIIRDGFMAAWNQLPEASRPVIRVYDTGEMSVPDALARATQEGAQFIVGPLTRPEVLEATENGGGRRAPMLALNFLPTERAAPPGLYQFALSPEDEARQIARRAAAQGQLRAIVVAPSSDWGNRVVTAFREELLAAGGSVIAQASYDPARNDYGDGIVSVLRINESRARHRRVEEILGGNLQFQARRRADVQMIFAAGQPIATRQLRPQLRFYYAGAVPTYMTSDGYDPTSGASNNQDLDGMIFPDMPWMLETSGPAAEIRGAAQLAWGNTPPRQPRLFAFGYDAHQLMMGLRAGGATAWPIAGVSGRLSIDAERRVHRELDWAQIRNGEPRLLPNDPRLASAQ